MGGVKNFNLEEEGGTGSRNSRVSIAKRKTDNSKDVNIRRLSGANTDNEKFFGTLKNPSGLSSREDIQLKYNI